MTTWPQRAIERWAMRSKPKAFVFLIGLGVIVSAGLIGSVAALGRIGMPQMIAGIH